jgi:hypothetical protein
VDLAQVREDKMHQKTKPDVTAEVPLQLLSENSIEAHVITAADSGTSNTSRRKRKEDASKPLYLKRV